MKQRNALIAILLLMAAGLQQALAQKVVLYKTNGETIKFNVSELDSLVFEEVEPVNEETHEYVDLGLPSGTLWATCNIGSEAPEAYGDYFSWGETEPKDIYDTSHYKFNRGSGMMTKYCTVSSFGSGGMTDDLTELLPEDDAATANWGKDWQMPSLAQVEELLDTFFTTSKWTSLNDFYGIKITSKKNGNWIFLPASGYVDGNSIYRRGSFGSFWSRSLREDAPRDAYDSGYMWNVRPVRVEKIPRILVSEIILSNQALTLKPEETISITATILPADAFFPNIVWESSNEMVAYVDSEGMVTASFPGTCTITCRAKDGSGVYAECQVAVEEEMVVTPETAPIRMTIGGVTNYVTPFDELMEQTRAWVPPTGFVPYENGNQCPTCLTSHSASPTVTKLKAQAAITARVPKSPCTMCRQPSPRTSAWR